MKSVPIKPELNYQRVNIQQGDYETADPSLLANMAFEIYLIREFENILLKLSEDGCIHGPVHTSIGHEACAVGALCGLDPLDQIASTHRGHHHYLAKLFSSRLPLDFNILKDDVPDQVISEIPRLLGEVMGLSIGCCQGRGGSMHLRNEQIGLLGSNAIVAGGVPLATGAAFAFKYNEEKNVVVCFLGDGAVQQGVFHESLNLAGIWKLPVVYFVENNQYAVATSIMEATGMENLAQKACAYNCIGRIVDGMDPLAVMLTMKEAIQSSRETQLPVLLEAKCYRFPHHAGPIAGSNFGYRSRKEEEKWRKRDPFTAYADKLIKYKLLTEKQIEQLKGKAAGIIESAVEHCTVKKDKKFFVKADLWPDKGMVEEGLRSDGREFDGIEFREKEDFQEFEQIVYSDAIALATGRNMEKDQKVFVLGEEIANFGGGAYGATKGLFEKYPQRVLNTPITEAGFVGLGGGAAMAGLRPVIEIMFADFALVAADQLFNQIGKLRHMYGNTTQMPVVVRIRIAAGCGYGGQHSMDPVGLFSLFSGWQIVAPSNAFDYIGLFNSAIRSEDPVLILEHQEVYPKKFDIPAKDIDYHVEIGKARIVRPGTDVTVLCYSSTVNLCKEAADQLTGEGIDAEVIDLRTVSPTDIDYDLIGDSIRKSGVGLIVEQVPESMGIGKNISHEIQLRFFDFLDGPLALVCGRDIPNPVSKSLEKICLPDVNLVMDMISKAARREV